MSCINAGEREGKKEKEIKKREAKRSCSATQLFRIDEASRGSEATGERIVPRPP